MASTWRLRAAVNWLNLSTPCGLLLARAASAPLRRGGQGIWLASDYRWRFPLAGAFTVGNVILARPGLNLMEHPALLAHEVQHSCQYARLGPLFLPLYGAAAGYSLLRTGSPALANAFERRAGLEAGGYLTARQEQAARP